MGCIYGKRTKRCEFHSISRPLTIERVRSSVCTQDISRERSFVEVLRNAERNLLLSSVPSDLNHPSSSLVLPAISPRDGVKDFRLRFVAAFVPLRSVSSPLHVALSYHAKKISKLSFSGPLFNRHSILFPRANLYIFFRFLMLRLFLPACNIIFL